MKDEVEESSSRPLSSFIPYPSAFLALILALTPWPAAWAGLYLLRSAPLAFVFYHFACVLGGFLLRSPGLPDPSRLYPLSRHSVAGLAVAANLVTFGLYSFAGSALFDRPQVLGLMSERGLGPSAYVWLFPYFALVNPLVEEFFWRGGVYATLRRLFVSWLPAALVASVLFGAWHWLVIRLFLAPILALGATLLIMAVGVGLCFVYERTRRLSVAILLHALAGDTPLLLLLLLISRTGGA